MELKHYLGITCILFMSLSGCSTSNLLTQKRIAIKNTSSLVKSAEHKNTIKGIISTPGNLRLSVVRNINGVDVICHEPSPDVAMSDSFGRETSLASKINAASKLAAGSETSSGMDNSINNKLNSSTTAVLLEGRSEAVLLGRDLLSHACLYAMNGWITGTEVAAAFNKVADTVTTIAEKEKAQAQATANVTQVAVLGQLDSKQMDQAAKIAKTVKIQYFTDEYNKCLSAAGSDTKKQKECSDTFTSNINNV